jgi:hypothetical protein
LFLLDRDAFFTHAVCHSFFLPDTLSWRVWVAVEALEHEGKEMRPTGKTEIARQRSQIIKEGLAAH